MKYLQSAAVTLVGYWCTRLKTVWMEGKGTLINTDSKSLVITCWSIQRGGSAQRLKENRQHVSEEEALIVDNDPGKRRGLFNSHLQSPKNYQYLF